MYHEKITAIVLSLMIALSMGIPACAFADDNATGQEGIDNGQPAVSEEVVTDDENASEESEGSGVVDEDLAEGEEGQADLQESEVNNELKDADFEYFTDYFAQMYLRVVGTRSIKVSWDADPSVYYVDIYRKRAGDSYSWHHVQTVYNDDHWTNTGLRKNTKYYYYIVYNGYDGDTYQTYTDYEKTRPNQRYLGCCENYGTYGSVTVKNLKVSYYKNRLRVKIQFKNERLFYAKKFKWIRIKIYDTDGDLIGSQKFTNRSLKLKYKKTKWKTFTFSKSHTYQKHLNLRYDADDYEYNYYYTYSY